MQTHTRTTGIYLLQQIYFLFVCVFCKNLKTLKKRKNEFIQTETPKNKRQNCRLLFSFILIFFLFYFVSSKGHDTVPQQ